MTEVTQIISIFFRKIVSDSSCSDEPPKILVSVHKCVSRLQGDGSEDIQYFPEKTSTNPSLRRKTRRGRRSWRLAPKSAARSTDRPRTLYATKVHFFLDLPCVRRSYAMRQNSGLRMIQLRDWFQSEKMLLIVWRWGHLWY